MTDARRPDAPERDPALDAAWRAYSVETPPPALDAAILAAARREARSGPRPASADDTFAEAREPSKWWWGLAAAATIGAIAFGLVQLVPPTTTDEPMGASDMPATETKRRADAAETAAREAQTQAPAVAAPVEAPPAQPPARAQRPPPAPSPAAREAKPSLDGPIAPRAMQPRTAAAPKAAPASAPPVAQEDSAGAPPLGRQAAPVPRPFPAAPDTTPQVAERRDADRQPALTFEAPATPATSAAETSSVPEARAGAADAARARREAAAPRASGAGAVAKATAAPESFIAHIEAALAAGRDEDAVRQLGAFREAWPDADERLPAALRPWAARVPRKPAPAR